MAKGKTKRKRAAPPPAPRRPARGGFFWVGLISLLGAAAAFGVVFIALRQPAPLGQALPPVPRIFEFIPPPSPGQGTANQPAQSVVQGRIFEGWLEYLAPQPDGTPPLRYPCHSNRLGFDVSHPPLSEAIIYPGEEYAQDGVEMEVLIGGDQPLSSIKYTVAARQERETVTDFVARIRSELEQSGARFLPGHEPFDAQGYRFERLEYVRANPAGEELAHCVFFGPLRGSVLCIDFQAKPAHQDLAWSQALKVMESFQPGAELLAIAQEQDAAVAPQADGSTVN